MAQTSTPQTQRITVRIVHHPIVQPEKAGKPTILVIEDEPVLLSLARMVLENSGYHVLEASSGDEALTLWQEKKDTVDLVLTDMVMPGSLSGPQVAQMMRADNPTLQVIYSSGYSMDSMVDTTGDTDPKSYLPKPYVPSTLIKAIKTRLDTPVGS
ncbi:MAG TPA: response regulator [Chthoniobacterales bacterium]|jgi:CheY-like chemotaxis protein